MAHIDVTPEDANTYRVTVTEGSGSTSHVVTATPEQVAEYGGGASAESLLEASFRFLLDREPKESILGRFEISVIARYFPEYPDRIGGYVQVD